MPEQRSFSRVCALGAMTVAGVCLAAGPSSCRRRPPPEAEPVRPVKLMTLEAPAVYEELSYPANVRAWQEAELSLLVPGRIVEIPVRRGEPVRQRQVLAKLDPSDYRKAFDAARAYAQERETYKRRVELALSKGAATELELEMAIRQHDVATAQMGIKAKALDDTILRAPFAGEIGRQYKEKFQDVHAKEPVFLLQDVTRLKVVVDVPESVRLMARRLRLETPEGRRRAESVVTFEDLPERQYAVEYYEAEQTADPFTRTYAVTFTMPAPRPGLILPGMSATLTLRVQVEPTYGEEVFYVPVSAVFSGPGMRRFVWVQDPQTGRVHRREVIVGSLRGDTIQVLAGLRSGETIAVSGAHHLREGMEVRPLVYRPIRGEQ
ncbi:MAG: efflux RND transporter periplasmic adaptor subunit [Planctomycetota bacterium]|jgi:RND family efflux transporter MFP subunit